MERSAFRRTYSYAIPSGWSIAPGHLVSVPFGAATRRGIVVATERAPAVGDPRPLAADHGEALSPTALALARWIAERYRSDPFAAAAAFLGPDAPAERIPIVRPIVPLATRGLTDAAGRLLSILWRVGQARESDLAGLLGEPAAAALEELLATAHAARSSQPRKSVPAPRLVEMARLGDVEIGKPTLLQRSLLGALSSTPVPLREALATAGVSRAVALTLASRGAVKIERVRSLRDPRAGRHGATAAAVSLRRAQERALAVFRALPAGGGMLLFGVTGSGKTAVYVQAIAEAIHDGGAAIVLVPEIALTPQTGDSLEARFPGQVALLHGSLTPGQHLDEWERVRSGAARVVIGARSALFAPVPNLRVIVLDEEHEWSFKQADLEPRYSAREVALRYAGLAGARAILSSATPDLWTYQAAVDGRIALAELPERVAAETPAAVSVVDMRRELRTGNRSLFSRSLQHAVTEALGRREQAVLFLNRRGESASMVCRDCGYAPSCGRCSTPLSFHADRNQLVCHLCNARTAVPGACPECGGARFRRLGAGVQRAAEQAAALWPEARVLRLDSDVEGGRRGYERIVSAFANHEADILVGTQLVAKGLDIPNVAVVGAVAADAGLGLPDFRAAERTFQLLTQVAGRAGRRGGGTVVIQSYAPGHYAIRAAARGDYAGFFAHEAAFRKRLGYPPFGEMARFLCANKNDEAAEREAFRFVEIAREAAERTALPFTIAGPVPAFNARIRGRYRWHFTLRGPTLAPILEEIEAPPGWSVDVDPASVL